MTTFYNISKLYSLQGGVRRKKALQDAGVLENTWMQVAEGMIVAVGCGKPPAVAKDRQIDLQNKIVVPGFIDAHSHLVFFGNRCAEYPKKIQGESYSAILKAGGGILNTVSATRAASFDDLFLKARNSLKKALSRGVCSMEVKSGYGLDLATELKQLQVIKKLDETQAIDLCSTYLGAHAKAPEYQDNQSYLDFCSQQVLPLAKDYAEFCDIFIDDGAFTAAEAEDFLVRAQNLGYKIKVHIDEIKNLNGSAVAVKLQATSVEHCLETTLEQLLTLADNRIPVVLLPGTSFHLSKAPAPAKKMRDLGVVLALGSDYNPGSCPLDDFLLILRLASRVYGLLAEEILAMATINAAYALDRDKTIGSLEVGKQADFVVLDAKDFNEVIARMDFDPVLQVYKKGERVYDFSQEYQ